MDIRDKKKIADALCEIKKAAGAEIFHNPKSLSSGLRDFMLNFEKRHIILLKNAIECNAFSTIENASQDNISYAIASVAQAMEDEFGVDPDLASEVLDAIAIFYNKSDDKTRYTPGLEFKEIGSGYSVVGYTGDIANVILPEIYQGKPVTSIDQGAFEDCTSLTSITIPNSVTSIDVYAFSGCTSLTSITVDSGNMVYHSTGNCIIETVSKTLITGCKNSVIPTDGSVTSIGTGAFYGYTSLTSITIPSSVTSIGINAFFGCTGLTSITIPSSVKSIYSHAFSGCTNFTSITIPNSVTSIGSSAFYNCTSLKSVTIGNGVMSIDSFAFCGCTSLTSITIPNSVTSIGNFAFSDCTSLTSINFKGTKAQWNAISKADSWDRNTGSYTVCYTDEDDLGVAMDYVKLCQIILEAKGSDALMDFINSSTDRNPMDEDPMDDDPMW